MAIPVGVLAKVGGWILPILKELLFGRYRVADYFRDRKVVLLLCGLFMVVVGLFLNMSENAVIATQHYRDAISASRADAAKLEERIELQREAIAKYKVRLNAICAEQSTYDCSMKSDSGLVDGQYVIQGGRVVGFVDIPEIK